MKLNKEKLSKDLEFTFSNLDNAIMRQSSLFEYYGELWAEAEKEKAIAEIALEQLYAVKDKLYRAKFAKIGEKITEAVIKSEIISDNEYNKKLIDFENIKYDVNILSIVKDAFKQRERMLSKFVDMQIQQGGGVKVNPALRDMQSEIVKNKMQTLIHKQKGGEINEVKNKKSRF